MPDFLPPWPPGSPCFAFLNGRSFLQAPVSQWMQLLQCSLYDKFFVPASAGSAADSRTVFSVHSDTMPDLSVHFPVLLRQRHILPPHCKLLPSPLTFFHPSCQRSDRKKQPDFFLPGDLHLPALFP